VRGYLRRPPGRKPTYGEALLTSVPGHGLTIPFVGLAEGMVLAAFRETGLPLQRIRPALDRLRAEHELEHALASDRLYSDGAQILYDYAREQGDKQLRLLTVVVSGQRVFHDVIERYLTRITYAGGWASSLVLPITEEPLLEVDPERAFGQPLFLHGGARLTDVRNRIGAGEDEAAWRTTTGSRWRKCGPLLPRPAPPPPEFFIDDLTGPMMADCFIANLNRIVRRSRRPGPFVDIVHPDSVERRWPRPPSE
jgi:hypothetical protein